MGLLTHIWNKALGSCASCVAMTLDEVQLNTFSGFIVTGGLEEGFPEYGNAIQNIKSIHRYSNDPECLMYRYDMNVVGPTFVVRSGNDDYEYFELNFENWPCIAQKLEWTLSQTTKITP